MMEEFYDEILKACGTIPSIYFSPMPAVSTIAANGEAEFYRGTIYAGQCALDKCARLKFHRAHRGKMRAAA